MVEKINTYNLCCECYGEEFVEAFAKKLKSATKKCIGSMPHDEENMDDEEEEDEEEEDQEV